jgi:hypothetical protein
VNAGTEAVNGANGQDGQQELQLAGDIARQITV